MNFEILFCSLLAANISGLVCYWLGVKRGKLDPKAEFPLLEKEPAKP